ncbi:MAG: type III-A CRISPR-associated protein Cas10/Csm1, partial [Nitrospirota bacterium]
MIDIKIGAKLPKARYIAFFRDGRGDFPLLNYSFEIWENLPKDHSAYLVLSLNDTEAVGVGFKYIANHIPFFSDVNCNETEHEHESMPLAFFDCIAKASKGDALLGYLKADVDNMGKLLRYSFQPEEPSGKFKIPNIKPSISRFCSFSRMLEIFFSGYLQMRLKNDHRRLYTIFSGGDDLFITGPWDEIIDFAHEMRKEFSRFTGYNPDLSFSSGILLAKPHEPISFCAEKAEEKLKASKHNKDKDRITLFDQTVSWSELNKILSEAKRVIEWLEKRPPIISRGTAYNFRVYAEMSQKYEETKDTRWLKFVPLLIYDVNRNLTKKEQINAYNWALNLSPTIRKDIGEDNLPYLKTIM